MVIAVSMPYSMLNKDQMKKILDVADRDLVTIRGLRSLSPEINCTKVSAGEIRKKEILHITRVRYGHGFMVPSAKDG